MVRLPRYRTGESALDDAIASLLEQVGDIDDEDLIFELIVSAVRLARDRAERGDVKIANAALKEMRHAFSVFAPYRETRKAAIFGSARTRPDDPLYRQAVHIASDLADAGWMVITGAGPGIMEAGIEGAGPESSFGVSIRLPFETTTAQLFSDDPKLVSFRYFFTRKLMFVKESHGFVLLPGGFGTLDETFELLTLVQTGKAPPAPIVLLDTPGGTYWRSWVDFVSRELGLRGYLSPDDRSLVFVTDDPDAALDELTGFYRNFHSQRYVAGDLVLRLTEPPTQSLMERINDEFADIVELGSIEVAGPAGVEIGDHDVPDLPRVRFRFDRSSYARLRQLIDVLNSRA